MQTLNERNISFNELHHTLRDLKNRQVDRVVKATELRVLDSGLIEVTEAMPGEWGVGDDQTVTSVFEPNDVFIGHLADTFKTGLPLTRRLFDERPDVAADLFNGLTHGAPFEFGSARFDRDGNLYPPDPRSFLFRGYAEQDTPASARALLSSKYRIMDNWEVMTAVMEGLNSVPELEKITVTSADLTDRHMFVNFMAPQIAVSAKALLDHYRSPFNSPGVARAGGLGNLDRVVDMMNRYGGDGETLYAGFKVKNSEVGDGKFKIVPYAKFRVCFNGLSIEADVLDQVHLGGKLDHGAIDWSSRTQELNRELVSSMAADAVGKFLSADYWTAKIDELAAKAGKPVGVDTAAQSRVEHVAKALKFSDTEAEDIWTHFLLAGQPTAGGVMNAVTSVAQTVPSAERADALEAAAVKVLDLV